MWAYAKKSRSMTLGCFFGLFLLLVLGGCGGPESKVSPDAEAFAEKVKEDIKLFAPPLIEPVSQNNVKKIREALSELFHQAAQKGRPLVCALYVLDNQGRFLTGHYPSPGKPAGEPDLEEKDRDYSKTKVISAILKKPKIMQSPLYVPQDKYYAIFVPLLKEGKLAGILSIAFAASLLHDKFGISDKDFLALNFNR